MPAALLDGWDEKAFLGLVHDLSFVTQGGSGLGHAYRDILEMDGRHAFRWVDRLTEAREEIVRAMNAAQSPKPR